MTERLYYTDSYAVTFTARVVERLTVAGRPALVLDRSCFYPTSGGQPYDTGRLNGVPVEEVIVRDSDGAVMHLLAADMDGEAVSGEIDWPRRFDHMQHHTGQHILTGAFLQEVGARTVSFHLGSEVCTIDLDRAGLSAMEIEAAEAAANAVVTRDLPVRAWFPAADELADLALRKLPAVEGRLRVVEIDGFDLTACGGTHVARTGEIGLIKVIRAEKYKDMMRVEFLCGGRARRDYAEKNALLLGLAADLTTSYREIGASIERLRAENKSLASDLRAARGQLLAAEADALWAASAPAGGLRVIARAWADRDPADLRTLAGRLIEQPGTVALLGLAGEKTQFIMARSADRPELDMVALLRGTVAALSGEGSGRGGGRPDFAQGGGGPADTARLQAVLDAAASRLGGA